MIGHVPRGLAWLEIVGQWVVLGANGDSFGTDEGIEWECRLGGCPKGRRSASRNRSHYPGRPSAAPGLFRRLAGRRGGRRDMLSRIASPTPRRAFDKARRGFSLVELLVVTMILATLSGLLFPVLVHARASARQVACGSSLARMAQATLLYLDDYDGRFPSCYRLPTPPFAIDPLTQLQPYLRNWELLYCPERHTVLYDCRDPHDQFRPVARCMGYGYNWGSGLAWSGSFEKGDGLVRPSYTVSETVEGVLLTEVAQPSHCLLYGDTNDFRFVTLLRDAMPGVRQEGNPHAAINGVGQPYEPPRHGDGNNFAFVDGHVQWLRFPGGRWTDGGPWVVPDMSMYSRTGQWEARSLP